MRPHENKTEHHLCNIDKFAYFGTKKRPSIATINIRQPNSGGSNTNNKSLRLKIRSEFKSVGQNDLYKQQQRNLCLPTLLILAALQNASTCLAFGQSELFDHSNFFGYHHAHQPRSLSFLNFLNPRQPSSFRTLNSDPPELMSSGSFSDQPSQPAQASDGAQNGWTSLLTNPFSSSNNNNNNRLTNDELDNHIKRILVPRVSGTQGNTLVRQYIVDNLQAHNYAIELDEFTSPTPVGNVTFANIVASSNPKACRQLVLACHYDSKLMDGFLGATDSAVPCAMLLQLAKTFKNSYRSSGQDESASLGLRFIFFDGEEAFVSWSASDSLYGSRHLAATWQKQPAPSECRAIGLKSELNRIELFVLLDLIGSSDTTFVSYNNRIIGHYESLQKYEKSYLQKSGLSSGQTRRQAAFKGKTLSMAFVEDDHKPFKERGVPVLLLLAHPFPAVWHTVDDNYQAIDFPRTLRILHVLEEFIANYSKVSE